MGKVLLSDKQFQELVAMSKCNNAHFASLRRSKICRFLFYNTPVSNYPPRKRRWDLLPIKSTSMPPNWLGASNMFFLALQREKKKKISEVFRGLPKLTQSWTEVFEDFLMLAQRIRKVSLVHTKTLWWQIDLIGRDPIRQSVIWPWKRRKRLFSFLQRVVSWLKRMLNLKKCLKKRRGELKKKTEIVLIRVQ